MKKFIIILLVFINFILSSEAYELQSIQYKNIEDGTKIKLENDSWNDDVRKKEVNYFVKILSSESLDSDYYSSNGMYAFSTGCDYEFIHNGSLIGYSNKDLKFYDFTLIDGKLIKRILSKEEVQQLFPNFKIVCISEFSKNTNSIKVNKESSTLKLILLNDTELQFDGYFYSSNKAKLEQYSLRGFIDVNKKGLIHFSSKLRSSKDTPWYIILVR